MWYEISCPDCSSHKMTFFAEHKEDAVKGLYGLLESHIRSYHQHTDATFYHKEQWYIENWIRSNSIENKDKDTSAYIE